MILLPLNSTRTDTLFPYATLFRSIVGVRGRHIVGDRRRPRGGDVVDQAFGGRWAVTQRCPSPRPARRAGAAARSEEHTSELQSLMSISYAVFCLKKKQQK